MLLAGVLDRSEDWEMTEICERKRIARWHDAALIAKDADPSALFITSPLQSHHVSDALLPIVVPSPAMPCYELPAP